MDPELLRRVLEVNRTRHLGRSVRGFEYRPGVGQQPVEVARGPTGSEPIPARKCRIQVFYRVNTDGSIFEDPRTCEPNIFVKVNRVEITKPPNANATYPHRACMNIA